MNLEVSSLEKKILINALRLFEAQSVDVIEVGKISDLRLRVESLKPANRRIAVMDEEGQLFVEGEEMTPYELGLLPGSHDPRDCPNWR